MNRTEIKIFRYTPSEGYVFWVEGARSELIISKDENPTYEEITIEEAERREAEIEAEAKAEAEREKLEAEAGDIIDAEEVLDNDAIIEQL